MRKALFPASFDPITLGHVNIIRRSSMLFDSVCVLVATNRAKKYLLSDEERFLSVREALEDLDNVSVELGDGLVTSYCESNSIGWIVRGLRNTRDFSYEYEMEMCNRYLDPGIETVYLTADKNDIFLSSSSLRQLLSYNQDISPFVPASVMKILRKKGLVK